GPDRAASDAAFAEIESRYKPRLIGWFMRRGALHHDALDLAQEVLLSFLQSRRPGQARFDPRKRRFSGWLFMLAAGRRIDAYRKSLRQRGRFAELPPSAGPADPWEGLATDS